MNRTALYRRTTLILAGSIASLANLALHSSAHAASQTWKPVATDGNWITATNWVGGAVPGGIRTTNGTNNDVVTFNAVSNFPTIAIDANRFISGIIFDTGAGAYTFTGGLLYLSQSGSITMNAGVTNAQVFSNTWQSQAASSTNGIYSFVNNSTTAAATLTFNAPAITLTNGNGRPTTLTLGGSNVGTNTISSNLTNATGGQTVNVITKSGASTWILSGANAFTGTGATTVANGIQINGGTLVAANNAALGTNATANSNQVSVNSTGIVQIANGITLDNGLSLNLNNGGTIQGVGAAATNGRINVGTAAATTVTLSTVSSGDVFTVGNGANDLTGGAADTIIRIGGPGTVFQNVAATNYLGGWSIDAGTLRLGSSTNGLGLATSAFVNFGAGSTGRLQLNGNDATVTGLTTNATPGSVVVENGAAGTKTLTLNNTSANTFAGILQNGAAGTLALTKAGAGTLTLSGNANTYSGATAVSAGVLNVTNTSGSATGTSNLTLGAATLTGAGIISGTVTAIGTSTITPGTVTAGSAGSGTLTVGGLTLASGTTLNYGLVSTGNTPNSNNYVSTGALTLPASGVVLNLFTPGASTPFAAAGIYNLFQYSSLSGAALSGSTFSIGTSIAGYNASFGTSGGYLQLTLAQAGALGTWTNGGATGDWSLAGNWSGSGTLPPQAAGDSAIFGATAPGTVNLDGSQTVGGLTFNNASAFTLSSSDGSTLTLDNVGAGATLTVTTGAHSILNALALNDNLAVTASSGAQITIAGDISQVSGTQALTKSGPGTLVLSGSNTYSGGTSVSAGVLQFNNLAALGSGTLALGAATTNGTLRYASGNTDDISSLSVTLNAGGGTIDTNGNDVTFAGPIGGGGAGGLTKAGPGKLTLAGANTYTGATTVSNGTISLSANGNLGANASGAQVIFTGTGGKLGTTASFGLFNGAVGTNDRAIAISGTDGTLAPASGTTLTVSGGITGSGQLIKADAGQLTITTPVVGQNTFSGGTLANAGTILLGDLAAAGNGLGSGAITFAGGTVSTRFQGSSVPGTQSGDLVNALVVNAGQTGTLILAGRQNISGSLTGSGTLNLQLDYIRDSYSGNWSGFTGQLNLLSNTNGGDLRINTLTGFGTAKLNLGAGTNVAVLFNFNPSATLSAGEISGAANSFLGGGTVAGRTLTWNVGGANTNAQFDGTIRDGGVNGGGIGPTAITKSGTGVWTLTGSNTYSGATAVNTGTLQIGNGVVTGSVIAGTSAITVGASGTLAVNLAAGETFTKGVANNGIVKTIASGTNTLSGAITGSGALQQTGSGTTTLTASSSYSGGTTVNAGTLEVAGALVGTTAIAVNSGGTLLLSGSGGTNTELNPLATISLDAGTLSAGGTTSSLDQTLGTLTLTNNSVLDFGTLLTGNTFRFANSSAITWGTGAILSVYNWTDGVDHLFFGTNSSGLTTGQLDQIKFYSDGGNTMLSFAPGYSDFTGGFGEVVPVPEPSSVATVLGLLGMVGWRERRQHRIARRLERKHGLMKSDAVSQS